MMSWMFSLPESRKSSRVSTPGSVNIPRARHRIETESAEEKGTGVAGKRKDLERDSAPKMEEWSNANLGKSLRNVKPSEGR